MADIFYNPTFMSGDVGMFGSIGIVKIFILLCILSGIFIVLTDS